MKPGKPYTHSSKEGRGRLRISQVDALSSTELLLGDFFLYDDDFLGYEIITITNKTMFDDFVELKGMIIHIFIFKTSRLTRVGPGNLCSI